MATSATTEINDLITTALDGAYGYRQAAENASDPNLKTTFNEYARQRDNFVNELQTAVRQMGGTPTDRSSVTSAFHRGWIGLKNAVTSGDKSILGECIRGDEHAVKEYAEVLQDDDVPAETKTIIARQHGEIEQALAKMNSLHNSHK